MTCSFRCQNCGQLVPASHAGEQHVPYACPVCKVGVTHLPDGSKTFQPDNWEVLADAGPERLAELGIAADDVVRHTPIPKEQNVRAGIETCKVGLAHHEARRAAWAAGKDAVVAEFRQLDEQLTALDAQLEKAGPADLERLTHERDRVRQRMQALADLEPSQRDAEHEAHCRARLHEHEAFLAGRGAQTGPQSVLVRARDGAGTKDQG